MNRLDDIANVLINLGYDPRKWDNLVNKETREVRVDLRHARAVLKITKDGATIISTPIRLTRKFATEVRAIVLILEGEGICVS